METMIATRIPESFFCSITKKIMVDPVLSASTGLSYEREAIVEKSAMDVSPPFLISNLALRETIRETVLSVARDLKVEKEKHTAAAIALLAMQKHTTSEEMEIGIKTLTGSFHRIRCATDATIFSIKNQISIVLNVPIQQQRLIFGGRQLEDIRFVYDYGITPGSVLHLVYRLRGGMFHETSGRFDFLSSSWRIPYHLTEDVISILQITHQEYQRHVDKKTRGDSSDGSGGGGGGGNN
jgi:hypothetical protein